MCVYGPYNGREQVGAEAKENTVVYAGIFKGGFGAPLAHMKVNDLHPQ